VRLSHEDLAVIAVATRSPKKLARIVVGAMLAGHEVDFVIERDARDFVAVALEVRGDEIVHEHVMPIIWEDLDERTRFGILRVYVQQMTKRRALAFRKIAVKEIT
jgi:hypothetical protein